MLVKNVFNKLLKCMMVLSIVLSGLMISGISKAQAISVTNKNQLPATDTLEYHRGISYGGSKVGNFTVRGMQAFCMQHPKETPLSGTKLTNQIYDNANIRKILYYGWGGPGQWSGFNGDKAYGIVATSKVLSHYYYGDSYDSVGKDFYNFIQNKTVPDLSVNFDKKEVTAYIEGNIQRTETITLASQSNLYGVTIVLDNDMTYVNENTKARQTGGTVEIKGQTRFHFEAPLSHKDKMWQSGEKVSRYAYQPIVGTPANSAQQKIAHLEVIVDPLPTTSLKVNWVTLSPVVMIKKKITAKEQGTIVSKNDFSEIEFQLISKDEVRNIETDEIIYEKGQVVGTYNLNKDGTLIINDLPQFKEDQQVTYIIKETKTADGLILDDTEHELTFDINNNVQELELNNEMTTYSFSKTDITGDKELEGAHLQVKDDQGNIIDEWISTSEKHIINGLTAGKTYTLIETIAPQGYTKSSNIQFKVLNTSEVQQVTMVDKVVSISKVDIGGSEIEGALMQVVDKEGQVMDEWTSSSSPHIITGLQEGMSYVLKEIVVANGYVKATDVNFTVTSDKSQQHVEMIDKIVTMSKVDVAGEEIEGASMKVFDEKGKVVDEWISSKQPHQIKGLEEGKTYTLHEEVACKGYVKATDIKFTVSKDKQNQHIEMIDKIVTMSKVDVAGEEIEGASMKVFDEKGKVVDEWISSKQPHQIKGLEEGKTYTLHEEVAIEGYVKASDIEFTVSKEKENQHIEMVDKQVFVDKIDQLNQYVQGAKLQVLDEDNNVVDQWESDDRHAITGLEVGKTYTLHEIEAPENYEISKDLTFTVQDNKENEVLKMVDVKLDEVYIGKYDATNMKELPGAHLEIRDEDGHIIEQWISTNEQHKVKLVVGKTYTLTETIAPKGYQIAKSIEFTVEDNGEVAQVIKMVDEVIPEQLKTGDHHPTYIFYMLAAMSLGLFVIIFFIGKEESMI